MHSTYVIVNEMWYINPILHPSSLYVSLCEIGSDSPFFPNAAVIENPKEDKPKTCKIIYLLFKCLNYVYWPIPNK